jgi:hypothetical protein
MVNGVIVPDSPGVLPDRVVFEPAQGTSGPVPGATFEYPHPLVPIDREKELALLRDRVGAAKAGVPGIPLGEAMTRLDAELNLPRVDAE